jgi:hypothetical protein
MLSGSFPSSHRAIVCAALSRGRSAITSLRPRPPPPSPLPSAIRSSCNAPRSSAHKWRSPPRSAACRTKPALAPSPRNCSPLVVSHESRGHLPKRRTGDPDVAHLRNWDVGIPASPSDSTEADRPPSCEQGFAPASPPLILAAARGNRQHPFESLKGDATGCPHPNFSLAIMRGGLSARSLAVAGRGAVP